jgi:hypothetical protein
MAPSSSILTATTSKRRVAGRDELQACGYPRLPAADFGLAGAAFLAAAFFAVRDLTLAFALSAATALAG